MDTFEKELENLINSHRLGDASNTPGFILADYLTMCLANFRDIVKKRDNHNEKKSGE